MRFDGPFDLPATLNGGQSFRWLRDGDTWTGTSGEKLLALGAAEGGLTATGAKRPWLERYLGMTPEDDARAARLAKDPILAPAVAAHPGLRLLRQDPWETTAAFITSANNNVGRIEGSMLALERKHGEPLAAGRNAFPAPARVARLTERELIACGLGYRAPFLRATAKLVAEGALDGLARRETHDLHEQLLALPGVGPKVADCIALFGFGKSDAFPIDRWVMRAVSEAFFAGRETTVREVRDFARARWGDDAGLAQQYLFHTIRLKPRARVSTSRWPST